jgi:hypothetical protein
MSLHHADVLHDVHWSSYNLMYTAVRYSCGVRHFAAYVVRYSQGASSCWDVADGLLGVSPGLIVSVRQLICVHTLRQCCAAALYWQTRVAAAAAAAAARFPICTAVLLYAAACQAEWGSAYVAREHMLKRCCLSAYVPSLRVLNSGLCGCTSSVLRGEREAERA